ncbi:F-box/LRR-repeat protein 13-like [Gossypium australe]|uniref:F-box/LRR-repeat protein 13-like n=1 Tax=Gossypium australe TaxID=47621 RepID=A0A5B6US68_9ROSI|nr:F-box/LRR-repeat protein 13-like [Gossypium australe]
MPNFVKFLKELLVNKRKLYDSLYVELNAVCSAILQNKLPNKLKDLGSFTIHCLIGSLNINNALADLGASLGKPKQTKMSIQLADRTIRFPRGIIEDVLVKIDKFIFLVDFVVLDMDGDTTARTIIDVGMSELVLCVGDEMITLQGRDSVKTSSDRDDFTSSVNMSNNVTQP